MKVTAEQLSTLQGSYDIFLSKLRERKEKLLDIKCCYCNQTFEVQAPPSGQVWDSLTTCYHCGEIFMKVASHKKAEARSLSGAAK